MIPVPPVQALCNGSGTLCELLLIDEALNYKILVPHKKIVDGLKYYQGHIAETVTYVGGHVESLKAGIFRSDFIYDYKINPKVITEIISNFDNLFSKYVNDYSDQKNIFIDKFKDCSGDVKSKGAIYHLDVGAMYSNIILTNRMQPNSDVNEDVCMRCDYNNELNNCKRKMDWVSRVEYLLPGESEVKMIQNQLENETFYQWDDEKSSKVIFSSVPRHKQESILKDRVIDYSKSICKKTKKTEIKNQTITVCQREIPFYVETVRKFRDQRYVYKDLYKKAMSDFSQNPTKENKKRAEVCNSIQTAYKCILNSLYGYVMREGSRWFSSEMAAAVCYVGGEII